VSQEIVVSDAIRNERKREMRPRTLAKTKKLNAIKPNPTAVNVNESKTKQHIKFSPKAGKD
jgi:hypothetical protein